MEKKTINPKIRTAFIAIFALAIVLSTTSLIMQSPIQFANAKNYFWDPIGEQYVSCPSEYDYIDLVDLTCVD